MKTTIPNLIINKWSDYLFKLETETLRHLSHPGLVTPNKISIAIESFKELLFLKSNTILGITFNSDIKLLIIFKIKTINNQIRSISYMQTIKLGDIDKLKQIFIEYWLLKSEDYYLAQISDIIFTYKILTTSNLETKILKINDNGEPYNYSYNNSEPTQELEPVKNLQRTPTKNNKMSFGVFNIPATMDIETWGDVHFISDTKAIIYKKGSHSEYHVEFFNDVVLGRYQLVDLKLEDKILLSFKDIINDKSNLSTFTRIIKNHEYKFEEGQLLIKKITKNVKFLTKINRSINNSEKFITMDLETRTIDGIMSSYCVSIYNGKICNSFYLSDYPNEKDMLRASITYLMKRKYHNHRIYLHNFSKFDAIFLLRIMTDLSDQIKPIIRNGQFIDLKLKFAGKYNLFFRDSLLLLPDSLRNLAKNFNVVNKGLFPYKFVNNINIPLDYKWSVPKIENFDGISQAEYDLYSKEFENKHWNLKNETIKYCELDCYVLYQIIDKFSKNIFKLFRIDILKYSTLSSLAFAIYRTKYLKDDSQIPLIHGEMYNFIKKSYTGGSVDVYKPIPYLNRDSPSFALRNPDSHESENAKKIKRYDVNSLYPFVMKVFPMPCGQPIYFEGDILKTFNDKTLGGTRRDHSSVTPYCEETKSDKPFGIFEVDVEAPLDIKIPLLQSRIKVNNGTIRTIAPIGNWTGHYFSDELYNASKYGYKFKIKRGYLFDRGNLFTDYVDFLYDLKKNSLKNTPNYIISKLLLNSLYGRLGMNPLCEQHLILSNDKALKLYPKIDVTNVLDLKNGKELLSFFNKSPLEDSDADLSDNKFDIKNVSVVVSSVVTASARIHMTQFKTDNRFSLYYTDTDSIDIDGELDPKFIGDELGQMKLEHTFNDIVFLGPKMYGGITDKYEYSRIKGLKNPLKFEELKALLYKDSKLEIKQEKWYKDISNGQFHIKEEIYTLMVTDNKRKLLYNTDNKFYDTMPLKLENGKIIDS